MTTLADVAALAEVSKATASRALSRPSLVAPETVRRVRAAAEQLGFVPNRVARSLARGRTGIVGVVVPTLDNSFFTPVIGGVQTRAADADLQVTIAVHALEAEEELGAFQRLADQVDGFIVVAPRGADEIVRAAASLKPSVLVDRELAGIPSVVADTATAFGALAAALIRAGHRRLVYLGGPGGSWQDRQRTAAVRGAARAGGAELVVLGPFPSTFAAGVAAADAVVASAATAAVPYATALGLGLMFGLHARGVRTPEDVTLSLESEVVQALGLTATPAIDVDGLELGRVAMDRLVSLVDGQPGSAGDPVRLPVAVRWPRQTPDGELSR